MSAALIAAPRDRIRSGASYYVAILTSALTERDRIAMLLRRLCPRVFYPGEAKVGSTTDGELPLPGIRAALSLIKMGHAAPNSWAGSAERYAALLGQNDAAFGSDDCHPRDRLGNKSLAGSTA